MVNQAIILETVTVFLFSFFSPLFVHLCVELTETTESLKTKMSELRLYCDLLMQQVHTIQESVAPDEDQTRSNTEVTAKKKYRKVSRYNPKSKLKKILYLSSQTFVFLNI